jgi:hypothetical protein
MRYRLEIYDANKSHDISIPLAESINYPKIANIVKQNIKNFQGDVKAYVFDITNNKKITAAYFPEEIHSLI